MAKYKLTFDEAKCKGCLLCAYACPKTILKLDKEQVNAKGYNPVTLTDAGQCTGCAMCAKICPDSIIKVEVI